MYGLRETTRENEENASPNAGTNACPGAGDTTEYLHDRSKAKKKTTKKNVQYAHVL